ncbi:MAG TPA: hypothetical protein V6C57_18270, partial [Coleofasciculaceae cyanobacterium]
FLAVIVDGKPLLTTDGEVQVFTLKLTSNKTKLIGKEDQPGTIMALNGALQKHYGAKKQWLTHLVSLAIAPTPYQFTSKESGETSTGIMFELVGGARPLPGDSQLQVFELVRGVDFQELAEDPFGLKAPEPVATAIAPAAAEVNYDDIPY